MPTTIRAVFDGETLRPEQPVALRPNATYIITIDREESDARATDDEPYPLAVIAGLATDMGVSDLAEKHDKYAHGLVDDSALDG